MTGFARVPRIALALVATFSLAACAGSEPAQLDTSAAMSGLNTLRTQFQTALNSGNVDGIMATYTDDAVVMPPHHAIVRGKDAIRAYYQDFVGQYSAQIQITPGETKVATAEWAMERGATMTTLTPKAGGAPMHDTGKYIVVVNKTADGSWKVAWDIHNSDTPMPPMPMAGGGGQ